MQLQPERRERLMLAVPVERFDLFPVYGRALWQIYPANDALQRGRSDVLDVDQDDIR